MAERAPRVAALRTQAVAMMPPPVRQAYEAERELVRAHIEGMTSSKEVATIPLMSARNVQPSAERLAQKVGVACGKGCSWCCRGLKVDVSPPEAVLIAEYLRELVPAEQHASSWQEVVEAAQEMRGLTADDRWRDQTPCTFLDQDSGECGVYEVRPLACRFHHSTDAARCEAASNDPDSEISIIKAEPLEMLYSLSRLGYAAAVADLELDPETYELTNAVALALMDPAAGARWRAGERNFGAAAIPSDVADAATAAADMRRYGLLPPEALNRARRPETRNEKKRARKAQRDARKKGRSK